MQKEVSEKISELATEVCSKRLKEKLGSLVLSVNLPRFARELDSGAEYHVEYAEQIFTKVVRREPRGIWEHIQSTLWKKNFQDIVHETDQIKMGDNLKSYLDTQVEALRPKVREHISDSIDLMASACVTPLQKSYQDLDKQLERLAVQLEQLRFADN